MMRVWMTCMVLMCCTGMVAEAQESNAAPAEEIVMLRTSIVNRYQELLKAEKLWDMEGTNWAATFWRSEKAMLGKPAVLPMPGGERTAQVDADLAMCRRRMDEVLKYYVAKQARLAGIADVVSSEIRTVGPAEFLGPELVPANTFLMTIDDGPSAANKAAMLTTLREAGVKAVFFHTGEAIIDQKVALEDYVAAGHDLGNHSGRVRSGDDGTLAAIRKAFPGERTWYRAPGGSRDDVYLKEVAKNKGVHLLWNVDSRDFELLFADSQQARSAEEVRIAREQCVANAVVVSLLRGRGIVLFHEVLEGGPEVVGRYLAVMKSLGYKFAEPEAVWVKAQPAK